jgi:hypothetical protein
MAKATKKSAMKTARTTSPSAAKYPRSTMTRVVPVAEAQEDAQSVAAPVVAANLNRRVTPELNSAKVQPKANAAASAARAATAMKTGKRAVRNAGSAMVSRRALISAEHFGYVITDLRIIGGIAVALVAVMVVLRFVLKI